MKIKNIVTILVGLVLLQGVFATDINHVVVNQGEINNSHQTQADGDLTQIEKAVSLLLPLQSTLTVGDVETHKVSKNVQFVPATLFIVCADARSLEWLTENHDKLEKEDAIGIVTNITSIDEFKTIEQAANGLPLTPVSVDPIAKQLGVAHYPVLISDNKVSQ